MFFDVDVPCWEAENFGPHGPCLDNVVCSDTECVGEPEPLPEVKPTDIPEPVVVEVEEKPKKKAAVQKPRVIVTPAPQPVAVETVVVEVAPEPEPVLLFVSGPNLYTLA